LSLTHSGLMGRQTALEHADAQSLLLGGENTVRNSARLWGRDGAKVDKAALREARSFLGPSACSALSRWWTQLEF
jgi:hypothetical protein